MSIGWAEANLATARARWDTTQAHTTAYYAAQHAWLNAQAALARRQAVETERAARDRAVAAASNTASWATCEHTFTSTGAGTYDIPDPVLFPVTFTTEPVWLESAALLSAGDYQYTPHGSATLREWIITGRGYYIGCYLSVHIALDDAEEITYDAQGTINKDPLKASMVHRFSFSGMAYKDIGAELRTQIHAIESKVPGYGSVS